MVKFSRDKSKILVPVRKNPINEKDGEELEFRYVSHPHKFAQKLSNAKKLKRMAKEYGYDSYGEFMDELHEIAELEGYKNVWAFVESGNVNQYYYKNDENIIKEGSKSDKINEINLRRLLDDSGFADIKETNILTSKRNSTFYNKKKDKKKISKKKVEEKPVVKPIEQLIIKPIERLIIKAAEKPVVKPVEKVAEKVPEQPIIKPVERLVIKAIEKPATPPGKKLPGSYIYSYSSFPNTMQTIPIIV